MLNAIIQTGVFEAEQLETVCKALAQWEGAVERAMVYIRISEGLNFEELRGATLAYCPDLTIIPGFEVGDGVYGCAPDEFFDSNRWLFIREDVKIVEKIFRTRDVCLIQECAATDAFKDPATPFDFAAASECYKLLKGRRVWFDIPSASAPPTSRMLQWIHTINLNTGFWPWTRFQWATAYPGTYDPSAGDSNAMDESFHRDIVGDKNFHQRIFVTRDGQPHGWPEPTYFSADGAYSFALRYPVFVTRDGQPHGWPGTAYFSADGAYNFALKYPGVVLYPKQDQLAAVGERFKHLQVNNGTN